MPTVRSSQVEIDAATAPTFVTEMRTAIDRGENGPIKIDCERVTFMDSTAYYAMRDLTRDATAAGRVLLIDNVLAMPAWVLTFCDWDHELTVRPLAGLATPSAVHSPSTR